MQPADADNKESSLLCAASWRISNFTTIIIMMIVTTITISITVDRYYMFNKQVAEAESSCET